MKTQLLLGAIALCAVQGAHANPITRAEARQVARQFITIDDATAATDDDAPLSPYYIFSRGAGQGFVIVSGDDSTTPILGYTEQGDYDPALLPPQLTAMLGQWAERISTVQSRRQQPVLRAPRARAVAEYKSTWTDVEPLIETHWHQSSPYNDMAPVMSNGSHCATGCVATAGSQVAYYFRRDNPDALQYATPTYGYGEPVTVSLPAGTPIEWAKMRLSGSGTAEQNHAVATLMFALGASAGLTYGSATSGHNYRSGHWNMADALRGQFNINYAYKGKWDASQQEWETLIYNNLATKRPMLYSGVHPDNGGHSVVLDGYQASTGLYHFNFGWGGQGDGYYTVDDATGMNGFKESQDLVYNFTPQRQNLSGQVTETTLWQRMANSVEVQVTNNGTLDYSGVYVYANSRASLPSTATATNTNVSIARGETATLSVTITPTTAQQDKLYLFLCDKSKNVLDTCLMTVVPTVADLHLQHIGVDGSNGGVTAGGIDFATVNNTTATVTTRITNGPQGTRCQPTFRCFLETYNTQNDTWTYKTEVMVNASTGGNTQTVTFLEGQTQDVPFVFTGLQPGTLYRAYLDPQAMASSLTPIVSDTEDDKVYFTVAQPDLSVTPTDGRSATVSGHWNSQLFLQLACDPAICSYDLSALEQLDAQPVAANANAVFYAPATATEWAQWDNVVVGDECQQLVLTTDADFMPAQPFKAHNVALRLANAEVGQWQGVLVPFDVDVPYGMQVKQPDVATSTASILSHQHTLHIAAMTPVVYLTSRDDLHTLTATDVDVTTQTEATAFDGQVQAATVQTALADPATSLLLGQKYSSLYFMRPADGVTTAQPFEPVVVGSQRNEMRTTTETAIDGYYRAMTIAISQARQGLTDLPHQAAAARNTLLTELHAAEDMLTYRSHSEGADITAQNERLRAATTAYIEAETEGIDIVTTQPVDNAPASARWYTVSGQPTARPAHGIAIVRLPDGTTRKVVVR